MQAAGSSPTQWMPYCVVLDNWISSDENATNDVRVIASQVQSDAIIRYSSSNPTVACHAFVNFLTMEKAEKFIQRLGSLKQAFPQYLFQVRPAPVHRPNQAAAAARVDDATTVMWSIFISPEPGQTFVEMLRKRSPHAQYKVMNPNTGQAYAGIRLPSQAEAETLANQLRSEGFPIVGPPEAYSPNESLLPAEFKDPLPQTTPHRWMFRYLNADALSEDQVDKLETQVHALDSGAQVFRPTIDPFTSKKRRYGFINVHTQQRAIRINQALRNAGFQLNYVTPNRRALTQTQPAVTNPLTSTTTATATTPAAAAATAASPAYAIPLLPTSAAAATHAATATTTTPAAAAASSSVDAHVIDLTKVYVQTELALPLAVYLRKVMRSQPSEPLFQSWVVDEAKLCLRPASSSPSSIATKLTMVDFIDRLGKNLHPVVRPFPWPISRTLLHMLLHKAQVINSDPLLMAGCAVKTHDDSSSTTHVRVEFRCLVHHQDREATLAVQSRLIHWERGYGEIVYPLPPFVQYSSETAQIAALHNCVLVAAAGHPAAAVPPYLGSIFRDEDLPRALAALMTHYSRSAAAAHPPPVLHSPYQQQQQHYPAAYPTSSTTSPAAAAANVMQLVSGISQIKLV